MAAKAELRAFLGLNTKEFERGLAKARAKANDFAKKGVMVAGAAVVTFGAVMAAGTKRIIAMGAELEHTRIQTGLSVKQNILLSRTLADAGVKVTDFGKRIQRMQDSLVRAEKGSARQADALAEIGLSATDLLRMEPGKQMEEIATALSKIEDPAKRSSIAMALLGQRGADFLLSLSPEGLEETRKHLGKMPEVMDQFAGAFERADTLMGRLPDKANQFFTGFASEVVGSILNPLERVNDLDFTPLGQRLGTEVAPWVEAIEGGEIWDLFVVNGMRALAALGGHVVDFNANALLKGVGALMGGLEWAAVSFGDILIEGISKGAELINAIIAKLPNRLGGGFQIDVENIQNNKLGGGRSFMDYVHGQMDATPKLNLRGVAMDYWGEASSLLMTEPRMRAADNRARAAALGGGTGKFAGGLLEGGKHDDLLDRPTAFDRMGDLIEQKTAEQTPEEQERQRLWQVARGDLEGRTVEGRRARYQLVDAGELSRNRYDQIQQLRSGPDAIAEIDEGEQSAKEGRMSLIDHVKTLVEEVQGLRHDLGLAGV